MKYILNVTMMGKPRMVRSDAWAGRAVVDNYWALKDDLIIKARRAKLSLPDQFKADFYLPMPASWSNKKKGLMEGKPHQQKPDKDNVEKALLDYLKPNDSTVWDTHTRKFWSTNPRVEIEF